MEALLEILGAVFENIFEWRKERAEEGEGTRGAVLAGDQQGSQPDGGPYSYQLGGRPRPQDGQGTSSRRGIRQ